MAEKKQQKAVAKKQSAELQILEELSPWEHSGQGWAPETSQEDLKIPMLQILQRGSPQVLEDDPGYIEGAREGMVHNTVTDQVFEAREAGILVVNAYFRPTFVEWVPRDAGGGLVADHGYAAGRELLASCTRNEKNKDVLPNGNELVRTHAHYLLYRDPETGAWDYAVVTMTSTQLKYSSAWNSQRRMARIVTPNGQTVEAPSWWGVWRLRTVAESNRKGQWRSWRIEREGTIASVLDPEEAVKVKTMAVEFAELVASGERSFAPSEPKDTGADPDPDAAERAKPASGSNDTTASAETEDEEVIPF